MGGGSQSRQGQEGLGHREQRQCSTCLWVHREQSHLSNKAASIRRYRQNPAPRQSPPSSRCASQGCGSSTNPVLCSHSAEQIFPPITSPNTNTKGRACCCERESTSQEQHVERRMLLQTALMALAKQK